MAESAVKKATPHSLPEGDVGNLINNTHPVMGAISVLTLRGIFEEFETLDVNAAPYQMFTKIS